MKLSIFSLTLLLASCASSTKYIPDTQQLDNTHLPPPNTSITIENLSSCTDANKKTIAIDSKSPITILVHGCKGSAGRFRSLAQLYAFHGQQAICYSYDDRASLVDSAQSLAIAVDKLAEATNNQNISIIGHSMGGLVSRKAMEAKLFKSNLLLNRNLELITVSAPISGIKASSHCGIKPLHWLSAGIIPGVCWLITGNNWTEIAPAAEFILQPKPLLPSVKKYLKIVTDEKNTCRVENKSGRCIKSDDVFDVTEQYHPIIDSYANITNVEVAAGHVEIIGDKRIVPRKLLSILQKHGRISHTPPNRKDALEKLLAKLY